MTTYIQKPFVSVIVPVFNQEKYIGRCLRSLLHQTMDRTEFEILVIDDASTDRTPYALSQFQDPRESNISVLTLSTNQGLPSALNKGISQARGDLIVRVDSDDFVNKNFLSILHYYLQTNESASAVACDYYLVDDNESIIARVSSLESPIACGIMFKKNCLFDVGLYDESFLSHEDRDLRIRYCQKYAIDHLPLPMYRYRRHLTNMTNDSAAMEHHMKRLKKKYRNLKN